MHAFITSIIRTLVPVLVGTLVSLVALAGIDISADAAEGLGATLTLAFTAAYYVGVRALEQRWPQLGILLGATQQPIYSGPGMTRAELQAALIELEAAEGDTTPTGDDYTPRYRADTRNNNG